MKQRNFFNIALFIYLVLFTNNLVAQAISDDFEDGNISGWIEGTASDWTNSTSSPITDTRSLKHNLSGVAGNSYIYHNISSLDLTTQDVTWQFNLKNGSWDPTGSNKFWVYLTANNTNLNGSSVDGYAVGVNLTGSTDILTLWKVTNGVADGAVVTSSFDWGLSNTVGIRVTRSSAGTWELLIDTDGGFDGLVSAGTASNTDYTHDDNFGLSFTFTSSRAGLLRMDDVKVEGNTAAPTIAFDSTTSSENETNATFTSANIPITVANYNGNQIDIDVDITGGTAEINDYIFTSPTSLSFTTNETQNISVDINPDSDDFDDETIIFTITEKSSVTGLVISQNTHTLTVIEDELPPTIGFNSSTSTESETDATFTSANIPITVSNYAGAQIDVNISVTGGTAEAGDYTFTSPTSLSFTTNETKNITIEINEDTDDFDSETIILTMTEISSVSGLVISQSTHTITITEDEMAPLPTAGSLIITEVLDSDVGFNNDYLELFNNSSTTVSLSTSKLIRMSSEGLFEYAYDFGVDEATTSADLTIPPYGFMIIARGSSRSDFNTAYGITLDSNISFNGGSSSLFFGTGRRWSLKTGGTANTDNGTLIDDTLKGVGTNKDYRNIFTDTFISGSTSEGTPGELEYLLYIGNTWVNSKAMTASTGTTNAYFYSDYTITSDADANNFGINTGNTVTLNSDTSLDVNGDLTINGSLSINSRGSLIVDGTSSGNLTYNRNLGTTNWYLISSPTIGQTIVDFYTNESPALGSGSGDAQNVAIDPLYNNSQTLATGRWNYYTEGQVDGNGDDDITDTFISGVGYSVKMQASGDIAFTGTMPVSNFTNLSLADNSVSSGNAFNLMGNPYPSYIAADNTANTTNNILSVNTSLLTEETIWMWDQSANGGTGGYTQFNNTSNLHIAPGQGFFVSANGTYSTFSINENMQSHQPSDTFQRTTSIRPEVNLIITNGTDIRDTYIFYIDETTTGFDNGYDSSIFEGVNNSFAIYTHAVANGTGRNLGIQSLPNSDFDNMIIPVGINATSGNNITISATTTNFSDGINVYLEDKNNNSFTQLDASSNFATTLTSDLNGIGRFYLHTISSVLDTDHFNVDNISIYTAGKNTLRIVGIQNGATRLDIYNSIGKQVLKTSFTGNGMNDIFLPNLKSGVYIIQIETKTSKLNKKIVIE